MNRRCRLLVAAVFAVALGVLIGPPPAQALILNHGMIVVRNNTTSKLGITLEHTWSSGTNIDRADVDPGTTWHSQSCCYAAGSPYRIRVFRNEPAALAGRYEMTFTPHLCNRNGVPYGYAVITIEEKGNQILEVSRESCYGGPL